MKEWHFTPGRVFMFSFWSFLLGVWVSTLFVHLELGQTPNWIAVGAGIFVAAGSLVMLVVSSRSPASAGTTPQR